MENTKASIPVKSHPVIERFPHAKHADSLLASLGTDRNGLSHAEADDRLKTFGRNVLEQSRTSALKIFFRQFHNVLVYVLMAASIIALLVGDLKDFLIIIGLVLFNGLLGFWQEIRSESAIQALKKLTESRTKAFRDGQLTEIPSSLLVPGDVLFLSEGDLITADLRLIETAGLAVDESAITGESVPVEKQWDVLIAGEAPPYEWLNMALAGTTVVRGSGRGVVTQTGRLTYFASIADKAQEKSPNTPLTQALQAFSSRYIIVVLSLLTVVGIADFLQGRRFVEVAYTWVAQLIGAVPEGLPLVVTLVMVVGAVALSKKKTLTRYLPSVETLGSATVIASDKTGTITEGKLTVVKDFTNQRDELRRIAALCNDAQHGAGDPIDVALSQWVGAAYDELRNANPRTKTIPFDSDKKYMATFHSVNGRPRIALKGAFEALRSLAHPASPTADWESAVDAMAGEGLRVLAFGIGEGTGDDPAEWAVRIVGLIGFMDPPKEGVKEAVLTARRSGMKVMMITGDHLLTARSIASQVGIWNAGDSILSGKEIQRLDDAALFHELQKATVLARTLPEQKYRVVKILQKNGEIVCVTGDGVNDVPALQAADLGIAMGNGSEAAKGAAKMILLDNNMRVIVDAIRNGRVIADNLRKVIYYLVSTNINQLLLVSTSVFFGLPLPLFPVQILWINLVTDGVQDKTFPFAREEGDVMTRAPRSVKGQFFDAKQIFRILYFGVTMGVTHLALFHHLTGIYSYETAVSILFTSVVVAQWFNGIQAQKENEPFFFRLKNSFFINPHIYYSVGAGLVLQMAAVYGLPHWFNTIPLSIEHWKYVITSALFGFALIELRKWIEFGFSWHGRRQGLTQTTQ